jgi:hypothetical protein
MLEFHLRRWGSVLWRILSIGIGVVLIVGGLWVLLNQRETYVPVVVSARLIPYGTPIQEGDLTVMSIPASQPPALRGIASIEAVVGRYGRSDIPASVIIQDAMISESPPTDVVLPNGYRIRPGMVLIERDIGPYADVLRESVQRRVTIAFDVFWGSVSPIYCRPSASAGIGTADTARLLPGEVTNQDVYEVGICYAGDTATIDLVYIADDSSIGFFEVPVAAAQSLLAIERNPSALWMTMIARAPGTDAPVVIHNPLYPSDIARIGRRSDSDPSSQSPAIPPSSTMEGAR